MKKLIHDAQLILKILCKFEPLIMAGSAAIGFPEAIPIIADACAEATMEQKLV